MKRILYIITNFLEIGLLVGTYFVNHFSRTKLGMMRWVNFNGMKWEENYPILTIKIAIILLIISLLILVLVMFLKKRKVLKRMMTYMTGVTVIVSIGSLIYIIFNSFQEVRTYYLIGIMVSLATVLQEIKTFMAIKNFLKRSEISER